MSRRFVLTMLSAIALVAPARARGATEWRDPAPDPANLAVIARAHRQWVIALRPPYATPLAGRARVLPARLAKRLGALGISLVRNLAGLPSGFDLAGALARRAMPLAPRPSDAAEAAFGLDPTCVWLIEGADSASAALGAAQLAGDPDVQWIEPNAVRQLADWPPGSRARTYAGWPGAAGASTGRPPATPDGAAGIPAFPNDPLFQWAHQWGLFNIGPTGQFGGTPRDDSHAVEGWSITTGSDQVILSVADTGIDPGQPDLAGNLADGRTRIFGATNTTGVDPPDSIYDRRGHGDETCGVMAARSNNGVSVDTLGMAGVCGGDGVTNSGCRIVPIKVTEGTTENATEFGIAQAILYAAASGARGMNLSLAGAESSQLERLALYQAITSGCVVSAAAGNAGTQAFPLYPSAYAIDGLCIEVGATDSNDQRAYFSSYGPWLDLVAPGVNIWTAAMTYPTYTGYVVPGYVVDSGTSFAAPHVAGTIGLLAALRPELIENDFQRIIRESAHDLGEPGVDSTTGWGRLDIGAALAAVPKGVAIWHGTTHCAVGRLVGTDSLVIADSSQAAGGPAPRVWRKAKQYEVTATVAIPDSFAGPVRIWPRVGGTTTVRGPAAVNRAFRLPYFTPWAEVASQSRRSFTLRGYIYQDADTCAGCNEFIPVPSSDLTFGFTVLGPRVTPPPWNGGPPPMTITPNPAPGNALIASEPGATVTILDLSGRLIRSAPVDPVTGLWRWNGCDSHGQRVRAGVYLVRSSVGSSSHAGKLVVLR